MSEQIEKQKLLQLAEALQNLETANEAIEDVANHFGDWELLDDCHKINAVVYGINDRISAAIEEHSL